MTVHLIKLCVGIDDPEELRAVQARRLAEARRSGDGDPVLQHVTRSFPRRGDELLAGGSLYWVIRGAIRARQRVVELREVEHPERGTRCGLVLDSDLVLVRPRPHRAFQGWRYLEDGDAPPDDDGSAVETEHLPDDMARELRELGLL